jgi:DivIVA domain-containing protein
VSEQETEFARVIRGYDPDEVDRFVQKLRRELLVAKTSLDDQAARITELEANLEAHAQELEQLGRPTFAGLGSKLESTLRIAEEQSARLVAQAETDAHNIRLAATREAEALVAEATEKLRSAADEAQTLVTDGAERGRVAYETALSEATRDADAVRSAAENEATVIRGEGATEIAQVRATARHEVEALKAKAEREAAELRLVLVSNPPEGVEVNDEILRILQLDVTVATNIDEMESEILARHQEAVAQTDKYLEAAQAQITQAESLLLEAEIRSKRLVSSTEEEVAQRQAEATERINALVTDATTRATDTLAEAENRAARLISEADAHVASLRVEREAIGQAFDGLRSLLAQASDVWTKTEAIADITSTSTTN